MLDSPTPALVALLLLALARGGSAQTVDERARLLFSQNCAPCHGQSGDGHGTTELDRPARSFKDGGFSFGNTPEALFRTISVGIAGTPMPGFDSSLSEEERKLLADYVVTLGPPIEEVKIEDTILSVQDRPLVVRGLLPSMGEGLPRHPRGLLIGDPTGITFEYQVDDVRLLGLRQGGFVRRTDWTGRGGTALEPLGKVVHLVGAGKPDATFRAGGQPLTARLSGSRVDGTASLEYHLVEGTRELAHVTEAPGVVSTAFGTGYTRTFRFQSVRTDSLALRTPAFTGGTLVANGTWSGKDAARWIVVRPPEGAPVYLELSPGRNAERIAESTQQFEQTLAAKDGAVAETRLTVLVLTAYDDLVRTEMRRWKESR